MPPSGSTDVAVKAGSPGRGRSEAKSLDRTEASPRIAPAQHFAVQVGAFTDRRNAERVQSSLERAYGHATIVKREANPAQWRVLVGREGTEEGAAALAERIRADPAAQASAAFVVRLDDEAGADSLQ